MNKEIALASLELAIKGKPNSNLSEHTKRLQEVYDWLDNESVGPSPPPEAPSPVLRDYNVSITLYDEVKATSQDDAWDTCINKISNRRGMTIIDHTIEKANNE